MSLRAMYAAAVALSAYTSAVGTSPQFVPLGDFSSGSFGSAALGVSDDGTTVIGDGTTAAGASAFIWTMSGGLLGIPTTSDVSDAKAIAADGSAVVGFHGAPSGSTAGYRWTSAGGTQTLVGLSPYGPTVCSRAYDVSGNGAFAVGYADRIESDSMAARHAVIWDAVGNPTSLRPESLASSFESEARAITPDADVVVGRNIVIEGGGYHRFSTGESFVIDGLPKAVSADGSVAVGFTGLEPFRWTTSGDFQHLGDLPGGSSLGDALGANGDGSIVVGWSTTALGQEAFIWTQSDGMRNLLEVLQSDFGLDLTGWTLRQATSITPDGLHITGFAENPSGFNEAFLVTLPSPGTVAVLGLGAFASYRRRRAR